MAYASSISHKYTRHSHAAPESFFAHVSSLEEGMIVRIAIVCVVLLGLLYVSETNALMFLRRTMPAKTHTVSEVKDSVRVLEIQATQLAASQSVEQAALANAMVAPHEVSYINDGDSAVALALPSVR